LSSRRTFQSINQSMIVLSDEYKTTSFGTKKLITVTAIDIQSKIYILFCFFPKSLK